MLISIGGHSTRTGAWRTVLRHRWPLRLMHWINLGCMLVLVGSGLQIFNAHPALYWGETSHFDTPLLAMQSERGADGKGRGITRVGPYRFDTTGVLGVSARSGDGRNVVRGFPEWSTIPGPRSLALGRRWHFFFAWLWVINGVSYLGWAVFGGHLRNHLWLRGRDWRAIPASVMAHLRFRPAHPAGDRHGRWQYNPLQKLAYLGVLFGLAPLAILSGLAMSPQMDSVMAGFITWVGGRQSARTVHFVVMSLFVLFVLVHVLMVILAGPINAMRSMLTGRMRIRLIQTDGEARHD